MAASVQFISVQYLKDHTVVEQNVDDNKLVPFIIKAQETYLQQILGTKFYDHLQAAFIATTLTVDEETLIRTYIQPVIAEYALYEALPFLNYKATNKAISTESSENSQPTGLDEVRYLRSNVKDLAEFYAKRLTVHLCDYSNLFPIYLNPGDKENLKASKKPYSFGIHMPKRNGINGISTYDEPTDCDC